MKGPDLRETVSEKYKSFGWTVIKSPPKSVTDLIASKDKKLHYIQITTPETISDAKFQDNSKSQHVQNAFSNNAVPIYAHVVPENKKLGTHKVTFTDINTNSKVIIGRAKKEEAEKNE